MLAAALRVVEGEFEDALDLFAAVDVGVVGGVAVVAASFLAEVHTSGELAHAEELGSVDELGFEWGLVDEALVGLHGSEVGVEAEFFAHGEESVLGAYLCRGVIVEARVSDGTEEDGVAFEAGLESLLGERVSGGVDGAGSDESFGEGGLVSELFADGVDGFNSLVDDFGANAVAW